MLTMKRLLAIAALVAGPALLLAQQNPNYVPSGPTPLGPGDPDWRGETIQSGTLPPETGGLDQARIMKPLSDEWTSYSGDLTGKRYSSLKLVNKDTVKNLSLKWITPLNQGCGPTGRGVAGGAGGAWRRRWRRRPWRPRAGELPDRRRRPRQRRREHVRAGPASAAGS